MPIQILHSRVIKIKTVIPEKITKKGGKILKSQCRDGHSNEGSYNLKKNERRKLLAIIQSVCFFMSICHEKLLVNSVGGFLHNSESLSRIKQSNK